MILLAYPAHATTTYCGSGCSEIDNGTQFSVDTASLTGTPILFSGSIDPSTGYTYDGVTFTDSTFGGGSNLWLSSGSLVDGKYGIDISLPSTVIAFSMTFNLPGSGTVSFSSPTYFNTSLGGSNLFFAALSSSAFSGLALADASGVTIKSFEIFTEGSGGSDSETPEESTLILIGAGLITLRLLRRKRSDAIPASA